MFKNYPDIHLAEGINKIDYNFEMENCAGCVLYKTPKPVKKVEITVSALLRIVKHGSEKTLAVEDGELCGLHIGDLVEVTNAIPRYRAVTAAGDGASPDRSVTQIEAEIKSMMNDAMMETNVVGRYVIADVGRHLNQRVLDQLKRLTDDNRPPLLLAYDRRRTELGKLYVRAYVLSDSFINYLMCIARHQHDNPNVAVTREFEKEKMRACGVYVNDILREIPVYIRCSTEQVLLMQDYLPNPELPTISKNTDELLRYADKLLTQLSGTIHSMRSAADYSHTGLEIKGILSLDVARDQASHLEDVCDSILMNIAAIKKI